MGTGFPLKLQLKPLTPIRKLFHHFDKFGNKGAKSPPLRALNKRGKLNKKLRSKEKRQASQRHKDKDELNANPVPDSTSHDQSITLSASEGFSTQTQNTHHDRISPHDPTSTNNPTGYTGGVALQTYSPTSDAIIITSLSQIPFCCHEDLLTMSRPQLVSMAQSINDRLPKALQIDTSDIRDTGFIRNEIEVLVGLRAEMPNAPKARKSFASLKEELHIGGEEDGGANVADGSANLNGTAKQASLLPMGSIGREIGRDWGRDVMASLKDFDFEMEIDLSPPTSPLAKRFGAVASPTRLEKLKEEREEEERAEKDEAVKATALKATNSSERSTRELERPSCIPRIKLDMAEDEAVSPDVVEEISKRPYKKRRVSTQTLRPSNTLSTENNTDTAVTSADTSSRTHEAGFTPFHRAAMRLRQNAPRSENKDPAAQTQHNRNSGTRSQRGLPNEYSPSPNRSKRVFMLKTQRTMMDMKERPIDPNDPFYSAPSAPNSLSSRRRVEKLQLLGPKGGVLNLAPQGLDTAFVTTTRPRYRFRPSGSEGLLGVMFGNDTSPSPIRPSRGKNLTPLTTPKSPGDLMKGEDNDDDNSPVMPSRLRVTRNAPRTPRPHIKKQAIPGFYEQGRQATPGKAKSASRIAAKKGSQLSLAKSSSQVEFRTGVDKAERKKAGKDPAAVEAGETNELPKVLTSSSMVVMLPPSPERRFHSFSVIGTDKDPDTKRLFSTLSGFGLERGDGAGNRKDKDNVPLTSLTVGSSSASPLTIPGLLAPGFELDERKFMEKGRKESVGETANLARGLVEMNMGSARL